MPSTSSAFAILFKSRRRVHAAGGLDLGPDASGLALEARHAAQSSIDTFAATAAAHTSALRQSMPFGAAPRARSALIAERGELCFAETVRPFHRYSPQTLLAVQAHFIAAQSIDPNSLRPVTGLIETAEAQIARARHYLPSDRARVQEDIACALTAVGQFLPVASHADLVTVLGQTHPLLLVALTGAAKRAVLHGLMPALERLLTPDTPATVGSFRVTVLHFLGQLAAQQRWTAAASLRIVEAWIGHLGQASLEEVAAGCVVVRHTLGHDVRVANQARLISRDMVAASATYPDKRALCASLLPVRERPLAARRGSNL